MVSGVDSSIYQQLYAAGASSGNISFGQGQQQFNPEEGNICSVDNNEGSLNGISGLQSSNMSGVSKSSNQGANFGFVDRLDAIDSRNLTPTYQDGEHELDLYA